MLRNEIREFIQAGVNALSPSIKFNSGRITEFNSARDNDYPFIWLESLSRAGLPNTGSMWNVVLHIAKKDQAGSTPEQYEAIVDDCDWIAQQLMPQYRLLISGYNQLMLEEGETVDPFIHKHADDTTGVILTLSLLDFSPAPVC